METTPIQYCTYVVEICGTLSDWKDWVSIASTILALGIGIVGLVKIFYEIPRIRAQKQKEIDERDRAALLKRTEFFLGQHRRLFDTPDLFEVLCLIDSIEMHKLALPEMWDKKRKFLAFFEEMALLVNNKMIDEDVADYMFSYYVTTAWDNDHFREGIDPAEEHWGLLFNYMKEAERRRGAVSCPKPEKMKL